MSQQENKTPIQRIVVLGGGTAGFLSAMTLKRAFSHLEVQVICSPHIPVVGVGESTTAIFPSFLHKSLGLDRKEFFDRVRPSWKLGIRFEWGAPGDRHFNYPFDHCMSVQPKTLRKMKTYYCLEDMSDASHYSAMMDRAKSPCRINRPGEIVIDEGGGYHLYNPALIDYLQSKAEQFDIQIIRGDVSQVPLDESGQVKCLLLEDGRLLDADLFIDCSGFSSLLLEKTLKSKYVSYAKSLFCDSAIVGSWKREAPVLPYTTVETMDHGWCWRIDFPQHVSRGYVFCSKFCTPEQAMQEMKQKNPLLEDDLQLISFRSGRLDEFWMKNVVAIGNAAGFAEPLEATALHLIVEQLRLLCRALGESDLRPGKKILGAANRRYRLLWDEVRDFLAVHFKFNRRLDTPFWQSCRENVDLAGATGLVDFYRHEGPSTLCGTTLPGNQLFGYDGFMTLLIGQQVETNYRPDFTPSDLQIWNNYRDQVRTDVEQTLPMKDGLRLVYDPKWQWPNKGL